jgi:Domain of unknown function (DUF4340)
MKGNVWLSIVALSLVLLAYTERSAMPPLAPVAAPEESSEPLFPLQPEEIGVIRVLELHGCVVVRQEGAIPQYVEKLVDSLVQARVVRRFSPASADLSSYGLTRLVRHVEVTWANGAQSRSVILGNLNPVGNAVYARVDGESDVLLVGSYFLTSIDMALQGLRAKGDIMTDPSCASKATSPD